MSYFLLDSERVVTLLLRDAVPTLGFWDTTWPACPRHPNHPLWYDQGREAWCCQQDDAALALLGELVSLRTPAT